MTICATLCYVQTEKEVLMLFRNKKEKDIHEGKWNGLGGKFLSGETPEECVIREVREESGLKLQKPQLKGMIQFPKFDGTNDWLVFIFKATEFSGDLITSAEGDLHWIEKEKLLDLKLWEGDYIFLTWLDKKEFFSAKFVYENRKLIDWQVTFYPEG